MTFVDFEEWQLNEIHQGIEELDSGEGVQHDKVATWLKSWSNKDAETKAL